MARKMIEHVTCDACNAKGQEGLGVTTLEIAGTRYDLCDTHGARFADYFADLFDTTTTTTANAA
ncbi:hypothetical protein ACN20G_23360 [Streptomyces sp. BI20]|uniref:hypothetical protein n=1 Tax=Streptomyces sp. BI20 TaxID=3403460 RepID=UPI003C78B4E0